MPDQELDERLRADLGAPDVRYMVVASAPTREAALSCRADAGRAARAARRFRRDRRLRSPRAATCRRAPRSARARGACRSGPSWRQRLRAAVNGLPVSAERLQPFRRGDRRGARRPAAHARRPRGHLLRRGHRCPAGAGRRSGWSALLPVAAVASGDLTEEAVAAVRRVVAAGSEPAVLLDLKGETDQLYSSYLTQAIRLSLAGFAAIVVLLGIALRSAARVARVLTPLALAVVAVAGLLVAAGASPDDPARHRHAADRRGRLQLCPVLRSQQRGGRRHARVALTLVSLLVANLATVLAFGVLAFSRVPVLADLGATVAPGAALALLFCALLSRPPPRRRGAGRVA